MYPSWLKPLAHVILPILPESWKRAVYEKMKNNGTNPIQQYAKQLLAQMEESAPEQGATASDWAEPGLPTALRRSCNLIMVTADNNNKFYRMLEKGDGTFEASYGRVGNAGISEIYPMAKWDTKYKEKIRKGYIDQTALFAEVNSDETAISAISVPSVRALITALQQYAKNAIRYHYNVHSGQVTPKQVEEAQSLINGLTQLAQKDTDVSLFNETLLKLYSIIPRKMKNVKEQLLHSIQSDDDLNKVQLMLAKEQDTLDVMRSQVEIQEKQREANPKSPLNLLEIMGLEITPIEAPETITLIRKMMQEESKRFVKAYKVKNLRTERLFDQHLAHQKNQETELFWHGSRNENWMSIMETGLVLRPANAVITGKMFGYGLYFADRFRKSLNYSSIQGATYAGGKSSKAYLAIFKVHTGKALAVKHHEQWHTQLTREVLEKKGDYDSVFARKGVDLVNNEYIVYHENQCTIHYLVEIT